MNQDFYDGMDMQYNNYNKGIQENSYNELYYSNREDDDLYIVRPGDTLWSIANRYGLSVEDLKRFNNLRENTILVGQVLRLTSSLENENYFNYTVIRGDTLWSIANRFNTTVGIIRSLNSLTGNTISVGQRLIIPQTNTIRYTVRQGDTLFSIARAFSTTVANLRYLNSLENDLIIAGQVLTIS